MPALGGMRKQPFSESSVSKSVTPKSQLVSPVDAKKRLLTRRSTSTSHSASTTTSFHPYGHRQIVQETLYSSTICTYCLQGGHLATCRVCGRSICYSRDTKGCIPFEKIDISNFRCPECCPIHELPYQVPKLLRAEVSGAAIAFIVISYNEPMFTAIGNLVQSWALQRSNFGALTVPYLVEHLITDDFGSASAIEDIKNIGDKLGDFAVRHKFPRLFVLFGAHSRPTDGFIAWGKGFAQWSTMSKVLDPIFGHAKLFNVSTLVLLSCGGVIEHQRASLIQESKQWGTLMAFGAPQVDPFIVGSQLLNTYLQYHVVGSLSAEAAVARAYAVQSVAEHTDIYLLYGGSQAIFRWTPPHMPNGKAFECCGQPRRVKKSWKQYGALIRVKLECLVKGGHEDGELRTQTVEVDGSLEGVRKIVGSDIRRFTIYYQ